MTTNETAKVWARPTSVPKDRDWINEWVEDDRWYEVVSEWGASQHNENFRSGFVIIGGFSPRWALWERCQYINGADWERHVGNHPPPRQ